MRESHSRIAERLAIEWCAAEEEALFQDSFSFLREKARDYKEKLELEARDSLKDSLIKDLSGRGYEVASVEISLGKYRGSRFVTSAKVRVVAKDARDAKALVKVLQRYHPRYSLKEWRDGIATYNIR